jgi:hypothetical protein
MKYSYKLVTTYQFNRLVESEEFLKNERSVQIDVEILSLKRINETINNKFFTKIFFRFRQTTRHGGLNSRDKSSVSVSNVKKRIDRLKYGTDTSIPYGQLFKIWYQRFQNVDSFAQFRSNPSFLS